MSLTDTQAGIMQITAILGTLALPHVPLGDFIFRHLAATPARPHWRVERWIYRGIGVDAESEQNWAQYSRSVLALSATGVLVLYAILRLQAYLPYSEGNKGLNPALAWDTAVSFVTNTSWQNLNGNTTWYNVALALVMLFGRYLPMVFVLALAGALARQHRAWSRPAPYARPDRCSRA